MPIKGKGFLNLGHLCHKVLQRMGWNCVGEGFPGGIIKREKVHKKNK